MTDNVDAASAYLKSGFSVIPIQSREKKPLIPWERYQKGTAPLDEINSWWNKWPDANLGIVTGAISGLIVVDLDTPEAKDKLKELVPGYDFTTVPRSRTGKGWQLFFRHPGITLTNRAGIIPGLDVRGDGGYVVAPPSIHPNGKQYRWEIPIDGDLPELPAELYRLISSSPPNGGNAFRERFNTAQALTGVAEGQRDETVFRLACKLRSADIPADMAETLILEAARNCQPPFPERTALEKVQRAYDRYSPGEKTQPKTQTRENFWPEPLTYKAFKSQPIDSTRWLWANALPISATSLLVGKPRDGKTTLALNLALAISRGADFLKRETVKSPVLYVSIDNSNDEIREMTGALGFRDEDQVMIHTGQIPEDSTAWLIDIIKKFSIKFTIVDTYQRFFHVEEINSTSQVIAAMEPLDFAVKQLGCHSMYLHHAKKSGDNYLDAGIGSNSLKAMCPYYFHLARMGESQQRILSTDFRSGKNFERVSIKIDPQTGWSYIGGTFEDAMVEDVMPDVVKFLEMEEEATEPIIRRNIPARGVFVSKAIRELYRKGTVDRRGNGRKGDPFKYYMVRFLSGGDYKGGDAFGTRIQNKEKPIENKAEILVPKNRDLNGTSGTRIQNDVTAGLESDERSDEDFWEMVPR